MARDACGGVYGDACGGVELGLVLNGCCDGSCGCRGSCGRWLWRGACLVVVVIVVAGEVLVVEGGSLGEEVDGWW